MTNNGTKVALVTGGSRGLGREMAIQLAKKGFDIIITYQNKKQSADEVVNEIVNMGRKAACISVDVSNSDGFDQFVEDVKAELKNFGTQRLHSLVNNAGIGAYVSIAETSEELFDNMSNIHLKAPYFITQKLLPILEDEGSIVNISSGLARFSAANYAPYAIMKAGVESLSRYMALEFGVRKIRVNTVAPGAIETDFGGGLVRDTPELNQVLASQTALGRVGLPDDIGSVVAFLCTEDAKWVNAQRIEVSGGFNI